MRVIDSKLLVGLVGVLLGVILTLATIYLLNTVSWPSVDVDLEVLIQNPFVKAIVIPIMLAILSALIEQAPKQAKGMGEGADKYKVWIRQQRADGSDKVISVDRQSVEDIARMSRYVLDIEPMASLSIPEFGSVAINLAVTALAVDIAAIADSHSKPINVAFLLTVHLIFFTGVVISLVMSQRTPLDGRRYYTLAAIAIGLLAMIFAFGIT